MGRGLRGLLWHGHIRGVLKPEDLNHLGEHQSSTHQFYSKRKITSMAKLWYSLYKCLPNLLFKIFAWCWWWWGHFSTRFNIWFPVSPWTRKADDISWSEWSVELKWCPWHETVTNNFWKGWKLLKNACPRLFESPSENNPHNLRHFVALYSRSPTSTAPVIIFVLGKTSPVSGGFFAWCFPFAADGNEDKRSDWRG